MAAVNTTGESSVRRRATAGSLRGQTVGGDQPDGVEAGRQFPPQLLRGFPPLVGQPLLGELGFLPHQTDGQADEHTGRHQHGCEQQRHAAPAGS